MPVPVLVLAVPWVIVTAPLAATAPVPTDPLVTAPLTPTPPVTTNVPVPVLVLAVPTVMVTAPFAARVVNAPEALVVAPTVTLSIAPVIALPGMVAEAVIAPVALP